jgi:hypothetical protein
MDEGLTCGRVCLDGDMSCVGVFPEWGSILDGGVS